MDKRTALRLERIRIGVEASRVNVDLRARRHTVILAVALTFMGTALWGAVTRQIEFLPAAVLVAGSLLLIVTQVRSLTLLQDIVQSSATEARRSIEILMAQEDEPGDDAESDP